MEMVIQEVEAVKPLFQCPICGHKFLSQEAAELCLSQGRPPEHIYRVGDVVCKYKWKVTRTHVMRDKYGQHYNALGIERYSTSTWAKERNFLLKYWRYGLEERLPEKKRPEAIQENLWP
jgi:hypothetical protein